MYQHIMVTLDGSELSESVLPHLEAIAKSCDIGDKVSALVAAARRAGSVHTVDTMSHFFLSAEMIIVGRAIGMGRDEGDVEKDKEGLMLVNALGQRMARLLKTLNG